MEDGNMEDGIVNKNQAWGPFFYAWCSKDLTPQASRDLFALAVAGAATRRGSVASVDELACMAGVQGAQMQGRLADLKKRGMLLSARKRVQSPYPRSVRWFTDVAKGDGGFVEFPGEALVLSGIGLRVAASIQRRQGAGTGWCWRTMRELAVDAGLAPQTVARALDELRALGGLLQECRSGRRIEWPSKNDSSVGGCPIPENADAKQPRNSVEVRDSKRFQEIPTRVASDFEFDFQFWLAFAANPARPIGVDPAETHAPAQLETDPAATAVNLDRRFAAVHLLDWASDATDDELAFAAELVRVPVLLEEGDSWQAAAAVIAIAETFAQCNDFMPTVAKLTRRWSHVRGKNAWGAPLTRFLGLAWALAVPDTRDRRQEPDMVREVFNEELQSIRGDAAVLRRTPK